MFQVFRLFHTYAFKSHIISCLCGIVLVYFQGLVKGLPPLVIPWWSALEDLKQRFGTTDLEWTLVAKFQRDGEPQGPQRREDLRRPAGTGSSGRVAGTGNCGRAPPPPTLFLSPWCLCPWFQGRHRGGCLSLSLLLAPFQRPSLAPSLSDTTPAGGLWTSSVFQNLPSPCCNIDQAHLDS